MLNSIEQVVNYVKQHGAVFDVETLGLKENQPMFSASWAAWGDKRPTTAYFDVTSHIKNASYAGGKFYFQGLEAYKKRTGSLPSFTDRSRWNEDFLKYFSSKKAIAGHNLTFDLANVYQGMDQAQRLKLQTMVQGYNDIDIRDQIKAFRARHGKASIRKIDPELAKRIKYGYKQVNTGYGKIGSALKKGNINGATAYQLLQHNMNEAKNAGRLVVADTLMMSKIFAQTAQEAGLVTWKDSKAIGHKLEYLAGALGRDVSGAHTEFDVMFNQPVLEAFGKDMDRMYLYASAKNKPTTRELGKLGFSSSSEKILSMLKMVDEGIEVAGGKKVDIREFNYQSALKKMALESLSRPDEKIEFRTYNPSTRKHRPVSMRAAAKQMADTYDKDAGDVLAGIKTWKKVFRESGKDLSGIERMIFEEEQNVSNAVKNAIHSRYFKNLPPGSTSSIPVRDIASALKSPGLKKFALYGAAAVGAATLYSALRGGYNAPPPQRISSKDDDYNTIEGLRHEGIAGSIRAANTDFGSGWRGIWNSMSPSAKWFAAGTSIGLAQSLLDDKRKSSIREGLSGIAGSMVDDVIIFGAAAYAKHYNRPIQNKYIKEAFDFVQKPIVQNITMGYAGYAVGQFVGGLIPGKDDAYNTIEGLFHGGEAQKSRRRMTDFGSGYRGTDKMSKLLLSMMRSVNNTASFTKSFTSYANEIGTKIIREPHVNAGWFDVQMKPLHEVKTDQLRRLKSQLSNIVKTMDPDTRQQYGKGFYRSIVDKIKNIGGMHIMGDEGKEIFTSMNATHGALKLLADGDLTHAEAINNIFAYHELAEARNFKRLSKKNAITKSIWGGGYITKSAIGSHLSPSIIAEEAIMARTAGEDVFSTVRKFRAKESEMMIAEARTDVDKVNAALKYQKRTTAIYDGVDKNWSKINAKFNLSPTPSKDDAYNTIEGLRHQGIAGNTRRFNTEFGSGYQGPNPDLNPAYNQARDVYRYEVMRASKLGLSEEELYRYVTEEDDAPSEFSAASASAGTALHQYFQAQAYQQGTGLRHEELVVNRLHNITGHIDIERNDLGVGDIKTVNTGIFKEIVKSGKPKPAHYAQVQFYLGEKGEDTGFIQYINRDNISQQKVYQIKFNPTYYENLLAKTERVRARVLTDLAAGRLKRRDLPMAASIERLQEDASGTLSPGEMTAHLDEYQNIFKEEMAYLRTVKRGMPQSGAGYERIQEKNKRESGMFSTQGIGFQAWNNRSKHHIMQG